MQKRQLCLSIAAGARGSVVVKGHPKEDTAGRWPWQAKESAYVRWVHDRTAPALPGHDGPWCVIPAKAGIPFTEYLTARGSWIPASAGMTGSFWMFALFRRSAHTGGAFPGRPSVVFRPHPGGIARRSAATTWTRTGSTRRSSFRSDARAGGSN